jgi:hypothetical protein
LYQTLGLAVCLALLTKVPPAWNKLITNINSSINLNPDRAVNSFQPVISIQITKPRRGMITGLNRIIEQQIPSESTLILLEQNTLDIQISLNWTVGPPT